MNLEADVCWVVVQLVAFSIKFQGSVLVCNVKMKLMTGFLQETGNKENSFMVNGNSRYLAWCVVKKCMIEKNLCPFPRTPPLSKNIIGNPKGKEALKCCLGFKKKHKPKLEFPEGLCAGTGWVGVESKRTFYGRGKILNLFCFFFPLSHLFILYFIEPTTVVHLLHWLSVAGELLLLQLPPLPEK